MSMLLTVVAFAAGVYVGKAHYDQFVVLVKAGWAWVSAFFKKTPPTPPAS